MKTRNAFMMGCVAILGLSLLGGVTVHAANPAISFQDGGTFTLPGYMVGYEFTVVSDISVTHLGYYDQGSDGSANSLVDNHEVGIFETAGQTLVATATVLTSDTLVAGDAANGYFVYHPLSTPVTLTAGTTYRIATILYYADTTCPYHFFTGLAVNPNLSMGPSVYASSVEMVYPTSVDSTAGNIYAAPNFLSEPPGNPPAATGTLIEVK